MESTTVFDRIIVQDYRNFRNAWRAVAVTGLCLLGLVGCGSQTTDDSVLTQYTRADLMDWHVSGLWVINSPVAWVRVTNYNHVPIHEITIQYNTFNAAGKALDQGTFTIEGTVPPMATKNFVELYLGLVDLYSERLSIKLLSVKAASGGH